jgi:bifunctional non-homologous end joining protein LigD
MAVKTRKPRQSLTATHLPPPPAFMKPQLLAAAKKIPEGKQWIHEIKYDGWRIIARLVDGTIKLMTRNKNDYSKDKRFKDVAKQITNHIAAANAVLDGEMIWQDGKAHYFIFDLLYLDGRDLRPLPLVERKTELQKILKNAPAHVHLVEHFTPESIEDIDLLRHACGCGAEGIVSKRIDSPYRSGRRSSGWLKIKCMPK